MALLLAGLLALTPTAQDSARRAADLRAALETMRDGEPGEPAFDAALPRLPDLIRSRSGWFVAGGAYLAGEHDRRECVPALIEALDSVASLDEAGRLSILDALIRLDVSPEPGRLPLDGRHAAETAILLARAPSVHQDELARLLEVSPESVAARWAVACMLVTLRDRRVATALIGSTTWPIDVTVRPAGSGVSRAWGSGGTHRSASHEPWPPVVAYDLRLPEPGESLGPVRYERREGMQQSRLPLLSPAKRNAMRARLLGELLEDESATAGLGDCALQVDWTDEGAFVRETLAHFDRLRGRILDVALALESRGLLIDARDAAARAVLRVSIHDAREGGGALPRPGEGPGVVYDP